MDNRNRNTAIVLIAAGVFLLVGSKVGFMTIAALLFVWFGAQRIRQGEKKQGYILLGIGGLLLLNDHFTLIIAIILLSLGYFYIRSKQLQREDAFTQKQNLMESLKLDKEPWELRNTSMWYVVGEVRMDLSLAIMEEGETTLILQGIVGDVDILVPEEVGVSVSASAFFGQLQVGSEKEAGLLNKLVWKSKHYDQAKNRVRIMVSYVVGDIDVKVL